MKNNSGDERSELSLLVVRWKVAEIGFPASLAIPDVILNYIGCDIANRTVKPSGAPEITFTESLPEPGKVPEQCTGSF